MDVEKLIDKLAASQVKQTEILERLAQKGGGGMHTKTPADAGSFTELHGVGSVFGSHSIEREVISAHVRPRGLASDLRRIPSVYAQPFFSALTGFTAASGSEAADPCDDNPAGYLKGCDLTAQFGRVARDTQTIEMDKVMLRKNRGDFTDLVLYGEILGEAGFTPSNLSSADVLRIVTKAEMVTAAVNLERTLSTHLWQGSPANNNPGGGYKEFPGLANQIATGQVDAHANQACPALDSDVKDFGYDEVCGTGRDIVEYLGMLEWFLYNNADRMGLLPVTWVIAMRPELWQVLSECWPCAYNTNRCAGFMSDANAQVQVDGFRITSERDQMRTGMYIDINGRRYPVITDTGIFEHNNINNGNLNAGQYASSIFMIPLTITGGFPVTYMEYVDYRAATPDTTLLRGKENFWTDDGIFSWAIENQKWCYKLSLKTEQRVVLRTPQLAGRIDSVMYEPLQHLRSPDPDSPYFADGGISVREDPSVYAVWA